MDGYAYIFATIVGILAGLGSARLTQLVYGFEDLFKKLPIHWMWWPALGWLFAGLGGLFQPRVLGVGYDVIHYLLQGHMLGAASDYRRIIRSAGIALDSRRRCWSVGHHKHGGLDGMDHALRSFLRLSRRMTLI